jgi:Tfp pilus assembly protein PilV
MTRQRKKREGYVLAEVLIAMLIFVVVMLTIAAMTIQISKKSVRTTGDSYRNAILIQEVNRIQALPYTALTVGTTTTTITAEPYPHTRTLTITNPATNLMIVKLVITPSKAGYRPDTVVINRRKSTNSAFDTQSG